MSGLHWFICDISSLLPATVLLEDERLFIVPKVRLYVCFR